jgi:hypothetical protein
VNLHAGMRTLGAGRSWDFAAAAVAGGLALSELVRLAIIGVGAGRGQSFAMTIAVSSAFVAVLAVTAIGMLLHRQVGWMFGVLGFLTAAAHGVLIATTGSAIGGVYIVASMGLFACVVKSLHWYRAETRNEIVAT